MENISFILKEDCAKLAGNLKKRMKPGYAIKTFGRVEVINDISTIEEDDEGWGTASPMQRVNTRTRREYIVYRAEPSSIDEDSYSEDDIMAAIRKINASKKAKENFGDKSDSVEEVDDWSADVDTEDDPW